MIWLNINITGYKLDIKSFPTAAHKSSPVPDSWKFHQSPASAIFIQISMSITEIFFDDKIPSLSSATNKKVFDK